MIPEHLRDTRHLTENMRHAIKRAQFTSKMFPAFTKAEREKQHNFFSLELSRRCHAEFEKCHKLYDGNLEKMKAAMTHVPETLIRCYEGDCSQCNRYSFLCGSKKENSWNKSYLPKEFQIYPAASDEKLLFQLMAMRLGDENMSKTRMNTSTQKSEAFNRTLTRCNPKSVTYKRNFASRIHSAAHLLNSGIADSTAKKCEVVGAPLATESRVTAQLKQERQREQYLRIKMKSRKSKARRRQSLKKHFSQYFKKMEEVHYKKGLLCEMSQSHADHSYAAGTKHGSKRTSVGEYPSTSPSTSGIQGLGVLGGGSGLITLKKNTLFSR